MTTTTCGDPTCPCQDGDACNHDHLGPHALDWERLTDLFE